ncbi:MAG: anticodon nuclease [Clostridia bacterium]
MGKSLNEIAMELKDNNKKVQLIYAFNGTGKTRLSRELKSVIEPKSDPEIEETEETGLTGKKILYYNAFTEDLFYWDNDLENDSEPKLKIQPNIFTNWVFVEQGQEQNISKIFQHYTDDKLTPNFNVDFSEITFTYERGHEEDSLPIKISKGEESCFIWSVFFALLQQAVENLNIDLDSIDQERETDQFNQLEYIFIDDPVTSLDENHLIELAVDLAQMIKSSKSNLKFIVTTHHPLFYNVLHNEFKGAGRHFLERDDSGNYDLIPQEDDSPFSYHLFLKKELEKALATGRIQKYHFNYLRNILEKTSTFLGYEKWGELLPKGEDGKANPYESRIINISSHSKFSSDEIVELTDKDKRVLDYLLKEVTKNLQFK